MNDLTWGDCSDSEYLKKEDIFPPEGITVTVEAIEKKVIRGQGNEPDKEKVCIKFEEYEKWLPMNSTNGNLLKEITNAASPADSVGKQVDLYVDPTVTFGNKTVGGIRFKPASEIPF